MILYSLLNCHLGGVRQWSDLWTLVLWLMMFFRYIVICSSQEEIDTSPSNLGMIAAYYSISTENIVLFSKSYTEKTKLKGILEVITNVSDFESLFSIREGDPEYLKNILNSLPYKSPKFSEASWERSHAAKGLCLIQAYLSRIHLSEEHLKDLEKLLPCLLKFIHASVDVLAVNSWLTPALTAMELSQYLFQATWPKDAVLLQIPHFDQQNAVNECKLKGIKSVYDFLENIEDREEILKKFSDSKKADIVKFCNSYPNIELEYEIENFKKRYHPDDPINVDITLKLDIDEAEKGDCFIIA